MVATVCGTVERLNKLITVIPHRSRYNPEIGDVVIGRVVEVRVRSGPCIQSRTQCLMQPFNHCQQVSGRRWRIDLQARQEANLLLSAVNLPGDTQRRRTAEDELNMRSVMQEGDLVSVSQAAYALKLLMNVT